MSGGRHVMYGASFSMYSGKLRAYLHNRGIDFDEVEPNALTYRRTIVPRTGLAMIPVLETPRGEWLQDTTAIIDVLESRHDGAKLVPADPVARLAAMLLELYGDEWLLIPAMVYRWLPPENSPVLEQRFGDLLFPWFPAPVRRWLGRRMTPRFSGHLRGLGVTPAMVDAFDRWYEDLLDDFSAHLTAAPFLLGDTPTLADVAFIGPFHAHLLQDPAPSRELHARHPGIVAWAERTMNPAVPAGPLPEPWAPLATLTPILRRVFDEQVPILRAVASELAGWAARQEPGARVPRSVGRHAAFIAGVETERALMTYPVWMLQRITDAWAALSEAERSRARDLLPIDEALLGPLPVRLARRENRLWLDRP